MAMLTRRGMQQQRGCGRGSATAMRRGGSSSPQQRAAVTLLLRHDTASCCLAVAPRQTPGQLRRQQHRHRCVGTQLSSEEGAGQELGLLLSEASAEELEADRQWIARVIAAWLDEEWTPLEVHTQLGEAAGAAYVVCRQAGDNDMSSLVLGLSNELLAFNYREAFVNAFEVANKTVEMLMLRAGREVCCSTDEDAERVRRLS